MLVGLMPVQAEESGERFCTYTATLTVINDDTPLAAMWVGMQFPLGTIVNGQPWGPFTFTDESTFDIPAGATATNTTTAVANHPPIFLPFVLFDYGDPFPTIGGSVAQRIGPTFTTTDCGIQQPPVANAVTAPDVVVYTMLTEDGLTLNVWNTNANIGGPIFVVTPQMIAEVPAMPSENSQIASSADGYYRFFRLNTGELQLNTGPDFEGKIFVTIFDSSGAQVVRTYTLSADGVMR